MSFTSKLPASWKDRPPPRKVEIDLSSPGLAVFELERLLLTGKAIISHADEVWPRLYIGDQHSAENWNGLARHGITHILNAAHSKCRRCPDIYQGLKITYMGVEANDSYNFDISVNFQAAADFIHAALSRGGHVLVHCHVGVSRSATLVLAYLMLKQRLTLVEAICAVKENRGSFRTEASSDNLSVWIGNFLARITEARRWSAARDFGPSEEKKNITNILLA